MKSLRFPSFAAIGLAMASLLGCEDPVEPPLPSRLLSVNDVAEAETGGVTTADHWVPHVSTVPANQGEEVRLFVRERVRADRGAGSPRTAVLMIHGASVPVLPAGSLEENSYDWALWLARSGDFDVFMLDLQGSGRSPRPTMDDPCNVPVSQQPIVPQSPTCAPSYPFQLVTATSDWDELDAVVDYIRALRGVDKVALIGWSHGAARVGPYAVQHPDKVESVLFYAPFYNPAAPAGRAGTGPDGFGPPIDPRTGLPFALPQPGTPMTLTTRSAFMAAWDREIGCPGQVEDGIQDVVWNAIMENDAIGRTWGPPEGVMRVRTFFLWGWNAAMAGRISVPSLIIHGSLDTTVPATQSQLYDHLSGIPGNRRLLVEVECTGHLIGWEGQRRVLNDVSKEWLKHGTFGGRSNGRFFVDTDGIAHPQ